MHEDANFDIVGRNLIIRLNCELDHHIAEQIRKRIDNIIDTKAIKNIIFDFEKVSFMDSSGIGVIMGRYKKVVFNKGRIIAIIMVVLMVFSVCGTLMFYLLQG